MVFSEDGDLDCNHPNCGGGPVRLVEGDDSFGGEEEFEETYECAMCGREGTFRVTWDGRKHTEKFSGVLRER